MMVPATRAKRMLIGTVGGQGGGVLSDWLAHGLLNAGWQASSIGLLGLSQRAGTVTYYCEASPKDERSRIPSVFAVPGDVDLILGQELLELARLVFGGFAAPHCAIVGNSARYLTTMEKMPAEGGVYDSQIIARAIEALAPGRHYVFDAQRLVMERGLPALASNAILLGAAVASPALGLPREPFHAAIRASQISVKANVAAFDIGYERVRDGSLPRLMIDGCRTDDWEEIARQRESRLPGFTERDAYTRVMDTASREFPGAVLAILAEALYRLIDYQDVEYAQEYLTRVGSAKREGQAERSLAAYSRNLAVWLTYEDAPRVAQLKTRRERFERIAKDFGIRKQRYVVTDYLVPDVEQILELLPAGAAAALARLGHVLTPRFDTLKFPLRIKTSAVPGYWVMRSIATLRRARRRSSRHFTELAMIRRWEEAIRKWRARSAALGFLAADAARVVKGYGRVRRQALEDLWRFLDEGLELIEEAGRRGSDMEQLGAQALRILAKEAGSAAACLDFLRKTQ